MNPILRLIFAAMCLILVGCQRRVEYVVKNGGSNTVDHVVVRTDSGHSFVHGILIAGSHSSFAGGIAVKSQNKLEISWTDNAGKSHAVEVDVSKGELTDKRTRVFVITDAMIVEKAWRWP